MNIVRDNSAAQSQSNLSNVYHHSIKIHTVKSINACTYLITFKRFLNIAFIPRGNENLLQIETHK